MAPGLVDSCACSETQVQSKKTLSNVLKKYKDLKYAQKIVTYFLLCSKFFRFTPTTENYRELLRPQPLPPPRPQPTPRPRGARVLKKCLTSKVFCCFVWAIERGAPPPGRSNKPHRTWKKNRHIFVLYFRKARGPPPKPPRLNKRCLKLYTQEKKNKITKKNSSKNFFFSCSVQ